MQNAHSGSLHGRQRHVEQDPVADLACVVEHVEVAARETLGDVSPVVGVRGRRVGAGESEQLAHQQVVLPEALALGGVEVAHEGSVCRLRRVGQAREDPEEELRIGRPVDRPRRVGPRRRVERPAHARVKTPYARGLAVRLLARPEEDRLHRLRRVGEPLERVGLPVRVRHQPGERERMGGLHDQRPLPVGEPDYPGAVHAPEDRLSTREVPAVHRGPS